MAYPGIHETKVGDDALIQKDKDLIIFFFDARDVVYVELYTLNTDHLRYKLFERFSGKIIEKSHPTAKSHRRYLCTVSR